MHAMKCLTLIKSYFENEIQINKRVSCISWILNLEKITMIYNVLVCYKIANTKERNLNIAEKYHSSDSFKHIRMPWAQL